MSSMEILSSILEPNPTPIFISNFTATILLKKRKREKYPKSINKIVVNTPEKSKKQTTKFKQKRNLHELTMKKTKEVIDETRC